MCCPTHTARDQLAAQEINGRPPGEREAAAAQFGALFPADERARCRCEVTAAPCTRKATGEDLVCDWCRETDHERWWAERAARETAAAWEASYGSDEFYQAGVVGGPFIPGPAPFEVGQRMRISVSGFLTPSEISSVLGLPRLLPGPGPEPWRSRARGAGLS